MPSYAVLLRGVNVGGHNRITMSDFRTLLEDLGHEDVRTYLQSGNAVIRTAARSAPSMATAVSLAIREQLGLDIGCLVRSHADLARIVKANPFPAAVDEPKRLAVVFLSGKVSASSLKKIDAAKHEPDRFAGGASEVYVWYRRGVNESKLTHALFQKSLNVDVATGRNWNTVTALAETSAT